MLINVLYSIIFFTCIILVVYLCKKYINLKREIYTTTGVSLKYIKKYFYNNYYLIYWWFEPKIEQYQKLALKKVPFFQKLFNIKYGMLAYPRSEELLYLLKKGKANTNFYKDKENQRHLLSLLEKNIFEPLDEDIILKYAKENKKLFKVLCVFYPLFFLTTILTNFVTVELFFVVCLTSIITFLYVYQLERLLYICHRQRHFNLSEDENRLKVFNLIKEFYVNELEDYGYIQPMKMLENYIRNYHAYGHETKQVIEESLINAVDLIYYYFLSKDISKNEIKNLVIDINQQIEKSIKTYPMANHLEVIGIQYKLNEKQYADKFNDIKVELQTN